MRAGVCHCMTEMNIASPGSGRSSRCAPVYGMPRRLLIPLPALVVFAFAGPVLAVTTNLIQTVTPASAPQGTNDLVVTFTLGTTPPPPPANVAIRGVTIGSIAGTPFAHSNQYVIAALFSISGNAATGAQDVTINYSGGAVVSYKAGGFTITPATSLTANFTATPANGIAPLAVSFSGTSAGTVTKSLWDFGDGGTSAEANPAHTYTAAGSYTVSLTVWGPLGSNTLVRAAFIAASSPPTNGAYVVVDTGQTNCYNNNSVISPPAVGHPFYGQDAQILGRQPTYRDNGDGTVSDLNTGLMWVKARGSQVNWAAAVANAANCTVGGYTDWRMPTMKELYSLVKFTGQNGTSMTSPAGYIPFIDTNYFGFAYGPGTSTDTGLRVIDAQDWSANAYVSTVMGGQAAVFGFNFTDGRIKGYPPANSNYVRYVRGNPGYGLNKFVINGDGTVTDKATWLMWSRNDSGVGLNWSNALAWARQMNAANYLGHNDWRLPNAKELQTLFDYSRAPDTTASAAISAVFNCAAITNEANQLDFPWYWSGTTLLASPSSAEGVYLCFGRAMAYMNSAWVDAHGAGAQRGDPKGGSLSSYTYVPYGYYAPMAPQGDAIRIFNHVRLVRDVPQTSAWRFAFVGDTHTPLTGIPAEIAASVANDDAKLLIVAGDLVEAGAAASTNTLASQLAQWRSEMAPLSAAGIPVYVIRGNHEDDVNNELPVWNNFFSGSYAMPGNGPPDESGLTYSFTHSNALFVALDNYVNLHRVNQPWLDQQLGQNTRPHLFVFGHEPAFKAFHTDGLHDYPAARNTFWSSLGAAGAKVYLCGHDHFYNVARLDDGDGNPANDLYQFIVGTGGTTNWPVNRYNYNGTNAPFTPVNVASVTNNYGYLLLELSGPGSSDLGVSVTWKQRAYDAPTGSYIYVATNTTLSYTAVNRYTDSVGDGVSDWWRARNFGGTGVTTNSSSCAACDPDGDGASNYSEYVADTNPTNALSHFRIQSISNATSCAVFYQSSASRKYTLYYGTNLSAGVWTNLSSQADIPGSGGVDGLTDPSPPGAQRFYRIGVRLP